MATIANQYDPNNPNQGQNAGGGGTVMPSTGGGAPSAGGGTPAAGGQSSGSSATPYQPPNVSQYLQANQGAGQQLTGGITKDVQNQANQLNNQVSNTSQQLNSQYQPLNQTLGSQGQQVIQSAFKDPQALLDSYNAAKTNSTSQPLSDQQQQQADQYNQFQQLNSGGYNGAIQSYGQAGSQAQNDLNNQYQNIAQQAGSATNEMGRNQLLQHAVGQGNYNQGEQTLDSLFLQGAPGQQNAQGNSNLQQLQQNLGGINQQANQAVQGFGQDINSKLAALQGLSSSDQSGIQNMFLNGNDQGTGLNQIGANVAQEYATGQANSAAQQASLGAGVKNANTLTADQLQQLGLTGGTNTWGVNDLTPYLTNNALTSNAQTATPEEFARYNALNQLAGGPNGLQTSIFGNATTAGGYTPTSFDANAFNSAVAGKQGTLQGDMKTQAQNLYNSMIQQSSTQGQGFTWAGNIQDDFNKNQGALANMIKSGQYDPNQLQQMASQFSSDVGSSRGAQGQTFNNWLTGTYDPAAASQLGVTSPDTNPLKTGWANTITKPQGK